MRLLLLLTACRPPEAAAPARSPDACFQQIAEALSDDAMGGRGVGTEGLVAATAYAARQMEAAGLQPAGTQGFFQPFEVTTGVALGEENGLSDGGVPLETGEDWYPMGFSSSGAFAGEAVFAGYGIRAEAIGYDDYAGLDVSGRVVIAFRYEPGEEDAESPFDGRRPSRWSDLRYKAMQAREAGAAALVLVSPPRGEDDPDKLPALRVDEPTSDAGLPVIQVTRAVAGRWLGEAGLDMAEVLEAIDGDYQPRSQPLGGLRVEGRVDLAPALAEVRNVVGSLPGRGALAGETIVVGAHIDHLGMGGRGSLRPDEEAIHNGADDNASGVAATICGVEALAHAAAEDARDRRGLVLVAFTAEEIGLGGSAWYAEHPYTPLASTAAMVNLDMVGRVRDGKLQVMGTDTAPEWQAILDEVAAESDLTLNTGGDGYGPSDQTSFYSRGVPVVHLFSGAHPEYHTPADDYDTLNIEGGIQVTRLLTGLLDGLTTHDSRLTYTKSSSGPLMAGDSRGFGAWLGTIPDYSAMLATEGGVLLADVRGDGPADRAGLIGGDRIVGMAGVEIRNLYDMTFVLRDHRPGDSVEIEVDREGEPVTLTATLAKRPKKSTGSPHGDPHGGTGGGDWAPGAGEDAAHLLDEREVHLAELRKLTAGGENAEGYFSPDGRHLIYQRTGHQGGCDQQYLLDLSTGESAQLSSGEGRTTCGYYAWPDGERQIYATTASGGAECPPPPDRSQGYVWPLYDSFELVWQAGPGAAPEPFLESPGYDAEATVCMVDGRVLFTSVRGGDLDLYVADADGGNLTQLTDTPGYDGGAFFSPDCSEIIWRASRPEGEALADYQRLLAQGMVRPGALEVFRMNADGSGVVQLTDNGAANFGPYPTPAGGVLFSSNMGASPREFDLYMVGREGGEAAQVTFSEGFDGFPMFSPDNRWLVFASNRGATGGETNLFIARWVE